MSSSIATLGRLTPELLLESFSFLAPSDISVCDGVSRSWKKLISAEDQFLWKQAYLASHPDARAINKKLQEAIGAVFKDSTVNLSSGQILSLISEYQGGPKDYKKFMCQIERKTFKSAAKKAAQGTIKLVQEADIFWCASKRGIVNLKKKNGPSCRWGKDGRELFVRAMIFYSKGYFGTKREINKALGPLPQEIPLRLLINVEDGSFKTTRDTVKIKWRGRKIRLICREPQKKAEASPFQAISLSNYIRQPPKGGKDEKNESIGSSSSPDKSESHDPTFREILEKKVKDGMKRGFFTQEQILELVAEAKISREWVSTE